MLDSTSGETSESEFQERVKDEGKGQGGPAGLVEGEEQEDLQSSDLGYPNTDSPSNEDTEKEELPEDELCSEDVSTPRVALKTRSATLENIPEISTNVSTTDITYTVGDNPASEDA